MLHRNESYAPYALFIHHNLYGDYIYYGVYSRTDKKTKISNIYQNALFSKNSKYIITHK